MLYALLLSVALAGQYERCDISNGQVFSCTNGWYSGDAVIKTDTGTYEKCSISNGQVFSCTNGWYNGTAIVYKK